MAAYYKKCQNNQCVTLKKSASQQNCYIDPN